MSLFALAALPPPDYRINEGDVLVLTFFSKKVSLASYEAVVDYSGYIPLKPTPKSKPAKVKIKDLTLDSAKTLILDEMKSMVNGIDAVELFLKKPSTFYVYIHGNFERSGLVLVDGTKRLSDLVLTDNLLPYSALSRVVVNGDTFSLWEGMKGDLSNNPLLRPGDSVFIPRKDTVVYVLSNHTNGVYVPVEWEVGDRVYEVLFKSNHLKYVSRIKALKLNDKPVDMYSYVKPYDTLEVYMYPNYVVIVGEVVNPGSVEYDPEKTVYDYIALAGGFTKNARRDGVLVRNMYNSEFKKVNGEYKPKPGDIIEVRRVLLTTENMITIASMLISTAALIMTAIR